MSVSQLQSTAGGIDTSANSTNRTQQYAANITAGSLLLASVATKDNNPGNLTVSDDKSNTWTQLGVAYESNSGRGVGVWWARANAGSVGARPIVTFNKNGSSFGIGTALLERGGVDASNFDGLKQTATGNGNTGPAEVALPATSYTNDEILAWLCVEGTGWDTATAKSGYTDLAANNNNTIGIQHKAQGRLTTTTGVYTPGWTLGQSDHWAIVAVALKGSTTAPTIISTDSATPRNGSSLVITGVNFGASQGTGSVSLGGVAQTVTAWSDTSITVTVARGTNKYGAAVSLIVTINGGTTSNTSAAVTGLLPQTGWSYIDLTTPNATSANRLTATADLASGDQVAWDTKSSLVVVYADATFSAEATVVSFGAEAWFTANGWGSTGTQTLIAAAAVTGVGGVAIASVVAVGGVAIANVVAVGGITK